MNTPMLTKLTRASLCASLCAAPLAAQNWTIPSGSTLYYDTASGPVNITSLWIEPGGTLRPYGDQPFSLTASVSIVILGDLDCSGQDAADVSTLNTTFLPEPGGQGGPGAGAGGVGSRGTNTSTPSGGRGLAPLSIGSLPGGVGGETTYVLSTNHDHRRAAGGGGGVLGPVQLEHPNPSNPANEGMIPETGWMGSAFGLGALNQLAPAQGGAVGMSAFVDANAANDFWGRRIDPVTNQVVGGELLRPLAGQGGGAGGDAVQSNVFPPLNFDPGGDEKGAGGGGGGGLCILHSPAITIAAGGRILANGGDGGAGENTIFFNRIGGGSGGGSGGTIILQADFIDLSGASEILSARGGDGGAGMNNMVDTIGAGGDGGPGLIQLHTPDGTPATINLPVGFSIGDLSAPNALVMLPAFP